MASTAIPSDPYSGGMLPSPPVPAKRKPLTGVSQKGLSWGLKFAEANPPIVLPDGTPWQGVPHARAFTVREEWE
jgi:hypothetical protein